MALIRSYRRDAQQTQPEWPEFICSEDISHVQIGDQNYKLSPEGFLMPVRRGQKPPDLKYFRQLVASGKSIILPREFFSLYG